MTLFYSPRCQQPKLVLVCLMQPATLSCRENTSAESIKIAALAFMVANVFFFLAFVLGAFAQSNVEWAGDISALVRLGALGFVFTKTYRAMPRFKVSLDELLVRVQGEE